jgi:hypothetical protein
VPHAIVSIGYVIELGQEQAEVPASIDPVRAAVEITAFVDGLLVDAIGGDDSAESIEAHCDDAVTRLLGLASSGRGASH